MSARDVRLVIGAGPIGLAMADALKRSGVPYEQVDAGAGVGGNWLHGVWPTAHIVSSKRSTAFADYPMPDAYPDFPSAAQMLAYLRAYAEDRGLLGACTFHKEVARAEPREDGRWSVRFADGEERIYKGVVVCNGHHWDRRYPVLPGRYAGELLHSKDYKDPGQLAGRRVLVIGGGNSGIDLACDAARYGRSSDISLRSGYWYLPKMFLGRPLSDLPIWGLPLFLQRAALRAIVHLAIGDYRRYGLERPDHRLFERHPAYGSDLLDAIRRGRVRPRRRITDVDGLEVRFADGTSGVYDLIVAATGFHMSFPFLPPGLVEMRNGVPQLYGGAFPPGVRGLAIVGWVQARNGFGRLATPVAGLYARLIALEDELRSPIGTLLEHSLTQRLPRTSLVDPERARREVWLGHRMLPLLKWRDRRLNRASPPEAGRSMAPAREAEGAP